MKISGKLILILLLVIITVFFSVVVAVAEEDPLALERLNAVIEITEYARQSPYTGELDFSEIYSALDSDAIIAAVNSIKLFINSETEAAGLEGAAFDAAVSALLPVSLLSFEDFDSVLALRAEYQALSADAKRNTTRVAELISLEAQANELAADEFLTLQSALPLSVSALTSSVIEQTASLREFFNHYMNSGASDLVDESHFLTIEQSVNALIKIEEDTASAASVDAMINTFPEIITLSDQTAVSAVRASYELLNPEAKSLVALYSELVSAEDAIAVLNAYLDQAEAFDALVSALPLDIIYDNLLEISEARNFYNALPSEAKAFVTEYLVLLAAEERIAELVWSKAIGEEIKEYIDALTGINLNFETRIVRIRARYEELNSDAKAFVTNYEMLIAAEARINALKEARSAAEAFQQRINALNELVAEVDAEDELSILNAGRTITELMEDYNLLSSDVKDFLENSQTIEESLAAINAIKDAFDAALVLNLIDALAEPPVLDDKPIIESARIAYEALTLGAKQAVVNYQKLLNAEAVIYVLENGSAYDVEAVRELIESLPAMITLECETEVKIARAAHETLLPAEQAIISSEVMDILEQAEAIVAELTDNYYKAMAVNRIILALGTINKDKAASVLAARNSYEDLTEAEKAFVADYQTLISAEARLTELAEAEAEAVVVNDLIEALPVPVSITDKALIVEAREAFNALSIGAIGYVTNYEVLLIAEDTLIALELAEAAGEVETLIALIPIDIDLSAECVNAIANARTAYDNLSLVDRSAVTNYSALLSYETESAQLAALEAARVLSLSIDNLPEVADIVLSDELDIVEVRANYEALSQEGKAAVLNLGELIAIESRLAELIENNRAADDFDAAVILLGQVENIDITKQSEVEEVRSVYDALCDEAKSFVTELASFQAIEAKLALEILRINTAVAAVRNEIAGIPQLNNLALRDAAVVTGARASYDELEIAAKPLVDNYETLISAELQIYRLRKYNDFNSSVSRIDYRDYEWSRILILAEDFIEELFASTEYEEMDEAYAELLASVSALPTALDHNKTQAKDDILRYAASIGYQEEIDFSTIDASLNVYEISEAADLISEFVSETRQAQIDAAIEQATYDIGNYITGEVNAYLEYMQISPAVEFDITEPEATYTDFRIYLAQAYGEQAIELIIILHKQAVIKMLYAEDEEEMETIRDACIAEIADVPTLSDDRDAYALQTAKAEATASLAGLINSDNRRKYTDINWQMLEITVSGALSAVEAATSLEQVQAVLNIAEQDIAAIEIGNYNWIVILIALVLGLSTAGIVTVFVVVIKQQKRIRARRLKKTTN